MADGLRFLVVDDTEELVEIITFLLARQGAQVEVATDGPTAVERASGEAFDVVLMDVGLPGIDGLEPAGGSPPRAPTPPS